MTTHLLSLNEYNSEDVVKLLDFAEVLKKRRAEGTEYPYLQGKCLGMIFDKPSNRTRISFEAGAYHLGGHVIYLQGSDIKMGEREPICDIARVISSYLSCVLIRTIKHENIEEFARHSRVPVINGLSNRHHPCQALADFFTIKEFLGDVRGKKIVFIGDGNNVCASLATAANLLDAKLVLSCPAGYEVNQEDIKGEVEIIRSPIEAVKDADVIYTDVWTSIGQDDSRNTRLRDLAGYQVNANLMAATGKKTLFMHCLPANRGEEVTAEVIESSASIVFEQAENRLHVQKAVLATLCS